MELINADYDVKCDECRIEGCDLIAFDGIEGHSEVCKDCLIKSILLIKPVEFDKDEVVFTLEVIANERLHVGGNLKPEFIKFCDWVKPFLESK